jgi:hypothetical protein
MVVATRSKSRAIELGDSARGADADGALDDEAAASWSKAFRTAVEWVAA